MNTNILQWTAVKGIFQLKLQMEDTRIHEKDLKYEIFNASYKSQTFKDSIWCWHCIKPQNAREGEWESRQWRTQKKELPAPWVTWSIPRPQRCVRTNIFSLVSFYPASEKWHFIWIMANQGNHARHSENKSYYKNYKKLLLKKKRHTRHRYIVFGSL